MGQIPAKQFPSPVPFGASPASNPLEQAAAPMKAPLVQGTTISQSQLGGVQNSQQMPSSGQALKPPTNRNPYQPFRGIRTGPGLFYGA